MNIKIDLQCKTIGYCRVSSNKQKDDLEGQIENVKMYLTAQGRPFEIKAVESTIIKSSKRVIKTYHQE